MFCKVKYCRYPNKHTTSAHQCGKCKKYGHGQTECNNIKKINNLKQYCNDILPDNIQCTVIDCNNRHTHTSDSHICSKCNKRHLENECIIQDFNEHSTMYHIIDNFNINFFKSNYNNHYIKLNIGMGCCLYVKNDNGNLVSLFMHSDSWGQYGPLTDDTPIKDAFLLGINELDINILKNINISEYFNCPLCRTKDKKDNVLKVKGSETKCKICLEEMATLFFPNCNHICCCDDCFKLL